MTMTDTDLSHSPPTGAIASAEHLANLRDGLISHEAKLDEARGNVRMADLEIELLEQKLTGWRKWRDYQGKRIGVFSDRIRADRQQLRMEEDFASGLQS